MTADSTFNSLSHAFDQLPIGGIVVAALLLAIGLILWAAGRKVLRAGFAVVGLLIGGSLGWALGDAFDLVIPAWAIAILLGLILALIAAASFRLVLALGLAAVFGLGSPLLVWTMIDLQGRLQPTPIESTEGETDGNVLDKFREALRNAGEDEYDDSWLFPDADSEGEIDPQALSDDAREKVQEQLDRFRDSLTEDEVETLSEQFGLDSEQAQRGIEEAKNFLTALAVAGRDIWDRTPQKLRTGLIIAAALGAVTGLLLGVIATGLSAAVVTSFGGGLIWMAAAVALLGGLNAPVESWLPQRPSTWLAVWVIVSVIGLAIQWTSSRRSADKSG